VAALVVGILAATPGALAAGSKPILGLTGNVARFHTQVAQDSIVRQAFLGWGQGQFYGSPFASLLPTLAPIPMLHLGTAAQGNRGQAIDIAGIAAGKGDGYLASLNQAVSQWGKAIYVRPLGEMNNRGNPWSGDPATYRKAFARIYSIVHGKVTALRPVYRGSPLAVNPFPRVRVVWSPLAGGGDPKPYWPGKAFVDVGGADIYKEAGEPPWTKFEAIDAFVKAQHRPFSVPEWGTFGIDDPVFFQKMCDFLKTHATETAEFFNSKPGSIFDLGDKPRARGVYKRCITPLAGPAPSWAAGGPGSARIVTLSLDAAPDLLTIDAQLSVPIVHWDLFFGDGTSRSGSGPPPHMVAHAYGDAASYEAVVIVYASPPFAPSAVKFMTSATVGGGAPAVLFEPTVSGRGKVSFRIQSALPKAVTRWQLVYGDGTTHEVAGTLPHFAGHTYGKPGTFGALLVLTHPGGARTVATATVHVS
jgi:hypothetical protein